MGLSYNWANVTLGLPSSMEYVPMFWGLRDHTEDWQYTAEKAILSHTTHLFVVKEPNMNSQADITVTAAVAGYLDHIQGVCGKAKLGSLAVTNGGRHTGLG